AVATYPRATADSAQGSSGVGAPLSRARRRALGPQLREKRVGAIDRQQMRVQARETEQALNLRRTGCHRELLTSLTHRLARLEGRCRARRVQDGSAAQLEPDGGRSFVVGLAGGRLQHRRAGHIQLALELED